MTVQPSSDPALSREATIELLVKLALRVWGRMTPAQRKEVREALEFAAGAGAIYLLARALSRRLR